MKNLAMIKITGLLLGLFAVTISGALLTSCKSAEFNVSNLTIAPSEALAGDIVTITVDVTNDGSTEGTYKAVLLVDGEKVLSKKIALGPEESGTVEFLFLEDSSGSHDIAVGGLESTLQVISVDYITNKTDDDITNETDDDVTNKTVDDIPSKTVGTLTDLSLGTGDITFSDNNPGQSDTVTIYANIHNLSELDVKYAHVTFYDGDPKWAEVIGDDYVTVSSLDIAQASADWTAVAGEHDIWVSVRVSGLEESDYYNNTAEKTISVQGTALIADAGGPYIFNEGSLITFDASGSGNQPHLEYTWDFDGDGCWDIQLSENPQAYYAFVDDWEGEAWVMVIDGQTRSRASAKVKIANVSPVVDIIAQTQTSGSSQFMFTCDFTDPGIDDTHTIEWDFGDGCSSSGTLPPIRFTFMLPGTGEYDRYSSNGILTPIHSYSETGEFKVTLTVTDDDGGQGSATMDISVRTIIDTPIAQDDTYRINQDTTLEISGPGILVNDSDGGSIAILSGDVSNGNLILNSDGSFVYTPNAGFSGTDYFTYKASSSGVESNNATVTIFITPK